MTTPPLDRIFAFSVSFDELFSGLIGSVIGVVVAGVLLYLQTREAARHQLQSAALILWAHLVEPRVNTTNGVGINPLTIAGVKDPLLSSFYRYRSLCGPCKRRKLDTAWKRLCGVGPGDYPRQCQLGHDAESKERVKNLLDVL